LGLYVLEIKNYPYWNLIALKMDSVFDFSWLRFFLALLIFAADIYLLLKLNKKNLGFAVTGLFFILLTVPSLISFTSKNLYSISLMGYHQFLFLGLWTGSQIRWDFGNWPVLNRIQSLYLLFFVIGIGSIPYLITFGPHLNLKNLLFQEVYETRREIAGLSHPYFGYTYSLFTKILIPLFLMFSLETKNRFMILIGVCYLLLFYLFGAHKTVFVALLVVFIFYRLSYWSAIQKIVKWSIPLILLCILLGALGFDLLWIYTFRRVHFIPALLDITYLEFFRDNFLYWSETLLNPFLEYPYEVPHAHLIGEYFFNSPSMDANNGIISDGYMNAGSVGVFANVLLVSTYFWILNSLNISSRYFGLYVLLIFSMISSSTLTVMLTHGGFLLLIVSMSLLKQPLEKT
jgi:hypothetical protein